MPYIPSPYQEDAAHCNLGSIPAGASAVLIVFTVAQT